MKQQARGRETRSGPYHVEGGEYSGGGVMGVLQPRHRLALSHQQRSVEPLPVLRPVAPCNAHPSKAGTGRGHTEKGTKNQPGKIGKATPTFWTRVRHSSSSRVRKGSVFIHFSR